MNRHTCQNCDRLDGDVLPRGIADDQYRWLCDECAEIMYSSCGTVAALAKPIPDDSAMTAADRDRYEVLSGVRPA